jgi:hypothetical protein
MNHWLILGLAIVAMVATVVVFMWWWTTENWDWASAELKPPRTVNTHPTEPGGLILLQPGEPLPTFPSGPTLEQRVTALEKDNRWHRTAAELLMNLEPRLAEVENVMNQIHKLKPPLPLAATPSQVTDASITGANWDVAEQESIPAPFQQSWQSAQPTTNAGRVERFYDSADPPDAST